MNFDIKQKNGVTLRFYIPSQDFVRLPLQNQSSQAQNSSGSSITTSGTGLSSQFGLSTGQLNSGYTSGPVNTGLEGVSRSLDETIEPASVPQIRS